MVRDPRMGTRDMDDLQLNEVERVRQLEAEREKLTEAQRKKLDHFCASLKANETYKTEYALKAAEIIRTEDGVWLAHQIRRLKETADQQGLIDQRKAADKDKAKALDAQKTDAAQPTPEPTNKQQQTEDPRLAQLIENARQLGGERDPAAAEVWVRQAESLDRQRARHGRYDFNSPPPPPSGAQPTESPQPPTPPRSPLANSAPQDNSVEAFLVAIAATQPRQPSEESKQPQDRSIEAFLDTVETAQPKDHRDETEHGLMKDFVDAETKAEVEFERAVHQVLQPSRGMGLTP